MDNFKFGEQPPAQTNCAGDIEGWRHLARTILPPPETLAASVRACYGADSPETENADRLMELQRINDIEPAIVALDSLYWTLLPRLLHELRRDPNC